MRRSTWGWLLGGALVVALAAGVWTVARRPPAATGPLIVVDAGHGGDFTGTTAGGAIREQDVNLAIALRLRTELSARGYRVVLTRSADTGVATQTVPSWHLEAGADGAPASWRYEVAKSATADVAASQSDLQSRVNVANRAGADAFISVHNNDSTDPSVRGTEAYAGPGDAPGLALAASVVDAVVTRTNGVNRGFHDSSLYVVHWTNMPAVLVESGYLTNAAEAAALNSGSYQDRIAKGIADGLDRWFVSYPLRDREPQISGADSASLASSIAATAYPDGAPAAVIMPAEQLALGPSAAALAASLHGPLLLASASGVSAPTARTLAGLRPRRVVVLGVDGRDDVAAIAAAVKRTVGASVQVEPLTAPSAAGVAVRTAGQLGASRWGEVAIADERDTGALAALAERVAQDHTPVLLSREGKLDAASQAFLAQRRGQITRVLAVGCTQTPAEPAGYPVQPVIEPDPERLSATLLPADGLRPRMALRPLAVDAARTVDVFSAAAESARRRQPLLQLRGVVLGPYTREFLVNRASAVDSLLMLRAAGSIPPGTESALRKSVNR